MLPKRQRLTKHMIESLFKNSRRVKTSRFLISYGTLPQSETGKTLISPCISMVVSKKVAKTAVLRNRLRRKGYASVAPLVSKIKPNMAILVTFQDSKADFQNADMTAELDGAFKKVNLYS